MGAYHVINHPIPAPNPASPLPAERANQNHYECSYENQESRQVNRKFHGRLIKRLGAAFHAIFDTLQDLVHGNVIGKFGDQFEG